MPEKSASRENREALDWALEIYIEGMRPFLVRELRKLKGENLEEAIRRSLRGDSQNHFATRLAKGIPIEECLDIAEFRYIVWNNWGQHFLKYFDGQRSVRSDIRDISMIRNSHGHFDMKDLNIEATKAMLDTIAGVLDSINDPGRASDVREIRDEYLSPTQSEEIHIVGDEEELAAQNTVESDPAPKFQKERSSPLSADDLLPDGVYDCRVTWVTEGVGQGSGQPYFRITFEELGSGRRVMRYYSLQPQAIEHLSRMMMDFGMPIDSLWDAPDNDTTRQSVLRQLREHLIGKNVSAEIVIEDWSGGTQNKVDRFFPIDQEDSRQYPGDKLLTSLGDDLPF